MKTLVLITVLLLAGAWQCFAAADRLEQGRAGEVAAAPVAHDEDPLAGGSPQEDLLRLAGAGLVFLAVAGLACFAMLKRRERDEGGGRAAGLGLP
jgi:hypothetical protein